MQAQQSGAEQCSWFIVRSCDPFHGAEYWADRLTSNAPARCRLPAAVVAQQEGRGGGARVCRAQQHYHNISLNMSHWKTLQLTAYQTVCVRIWQVYEWCHNAAVRGQHPAVRNVTVSFLIRCEHRLELWLQLRVRCLGFTCSLRAFMFHLKTFSLSSSFSSFAFRLQKTSVSFATM